MSEKNTFVRSLHDVGLAAWFGGSMMGAVGLNGATAQAVDPQERLELSTLGWTRWAPVAGAAVAAHLVGGAGLIQANKGRVASQPGARANTVTKTALTAAAVGLTAWSGVLNRTLATKAKRTRQGTIGATEPSSTSDPELQSAQRQLKLLQWAIPATTGALVVLGAQQGEQQRPQSLLRNQTARFTS